MTVGTFAVDEATFSAHKPSEIHVAINTRVSRQPISTSYLLSEMGGSVKKTFVATRNIIGVAGLLLAGYVLVTSLPDLGRYIKISRM